MAFVEPVTLRANGVRLEPLALEHEAGLAAAAADGELWRLRITSVPTPQETRAYIETALQMRAEGHRFAFAVIEDTTDRVLGSTSFHDILPAVPQPEYVAADRRTAIEYAVQHAAASDIVLIAGKGHETYQDVKGVKSHFDDKEVLEEIFKGEL